MRMNADKIHISPLSALTVIILFFFNPPEYVCTMLMCALLHESGHLVAMRIMGIRHEKITVTPLGADIKMPWTRGYGTDMLVYVSGAAANFFGAVSAYTVYIARPSTIVMFIMISNLLYAVFNMLPIRGLDGGGFAEALLMKYTSPDTAWRICGILSCVSMLFLVAFAVFMIFASGTNFSLFLIILHLFVGLTKK